MTDTTINVDRNPLWHIALVVVRRKALWAPFSLKRQRRDTA